MTDGRRAVVCDDDPMIALVASILLEEEGFDVTVAGTGGELAEALLAGQPDLVVLDHELPDASGEDLIGVIATAAPACRVIVFTGRETASNAVAVFARVSKRGTDELAAAIHRAATE